jgi:hypothetical protein
MDDGQRRQAHRCLQHLHEAQQVLEARDDMVLRDALSEEGVSRDAAREDGDEPHPAPAGRLDIRVPIPDVDGRFLTECCGDALVSMMEIGGAMHSAGTRLALAHGEYLPGQSCPQP